MRNVRIFWWMIVGAVSAAAAAETTPIRRPEPPGKPGFDARLPLEEKDRGGFVLRAPSASQRITAEALGAEMPGLTLRWNGMSGGPKWIAAASERSLTPPSTEDPEIVARAFLRARAAVFGLAPTEIDRLKLHAVVRTPAGGPHVHLVQRAWGLEVFGSHVKVNLDPNGAVRSVGATLFGRMQHAAAPVISPAEAMRIAVADVYPASVAPTAVETQEADGERRTVFRADGFGFPPEARLVLFPEADGQRLAWEVKIGEPTLFTSYVVLIDAVDGRLLYRENTTLYAEAAYLHGEAPDPMTEEFAPAAYLRATIPASTPQSPIGWITGTGTSLTGNNASSHLGHRSMAGLSEPSGVYDYPFNTPRSSLVNSWWWANEAHDRFYDLGFTETAGNFQQDNFGLGGVGGDAMQIVEIVNFWRGESAFFTPVTVDGGVSSLNVGWVSCRFCSDHDGLLDEDDEAPGERSDGFNRTTVFHEYTHGVSTRLVGAGVTGCLGAVQSGALGEGWSDLFAASFYDVPETFKFIYEGTGFARHLSNDLTYDQLCEIYDYGQACQFHADSLIWTGTLWELRRSMVALDPAAGLDKFHRIVLEGMASTPCNPDYLDARDAILDADQALYASAHRTAIWNAFASRGMGSGASSAGGAADTAPVTSYSVPPQDSCAAPAAPTGLTAAPDGNNRIRLSYSAAGAQAVEIWRDDLDNAVDRAVRIGATNDLATSVDDTVQGGKSYRYHLLAFGAGGVPCKSAASSTADATAAGTCAAYPRFVPNLTATTGDPSCAITLTWSAAQAGCPGSSDPIVYDVYRAPAPGFEPSEALHVGTTSATTFIDTPPAVAEFLATYSGWTKVPHYLVLARHGSLSDPPDHRLRGSAQVMQWVGVVPTLGRTSVASWNFDGGPQGWTTDNSADPTGGWVRVAPHGTRYGDILLAPDEPAGGAGMSWVTGDAGGPSNAVAKDCDKTSYLISPVWDGTGGATIVSLDYWNWMYGNFWAGLDLWVDNGSTEVRVPFAGLMTAQVFDAPGRFGWQHTEFDVATVIAPTSTMTMKFVNYCGFPVSEFGIDNVKVERAASCSRSGLRIQSASFDDSAPGWGNGNGVLEPGETARVQVRLVNDGSATAFVPVGTLRVGAVGAAVHESTASFPDISPAATGDSLAPHFTVTAPVGASCNDTLAFEFEFVDASGAISRDRWFPEYGATTTQVAFADTFETNKSWGTQGFTNRGIFQRGDPVGTLDGANQANPENDSPNDAGAQCYVTENGAPGGAASAKDVDGPGPIWPRLTSPSIDMTGYKRASLRFDLWAYDNSTATPTQDYVEYAAFVNSDVGRRRYWTIGATTSGWTTVVEDLSHAEPMKSDYRVEFVAYDTGTDNIVEFGIDNVVVEGSKQICTALGVDAPPNGVGDSVRIGKTGANAAVSWTASAIDATHDGAAYYRLHASGSPSGGFSVSDTATGTSTQQPLSGASRYYLVSAVNASGTSGDEPAP